jgi:hypothetical protein
MEATFTETAGVEANPHRTALRKFLKAVYSVIAGVLADGARGDSLDRVLATSSSASFAALPRSQQDRLLDRGFRPSH